MAGEKPLTKSDLLAILREAGIPTKGDVQRIVSNEISSRGLTTKDDLKGLATKDDLVHMERRLKLRMGKMRSNLFQAIGNLAINSPTIQAFQKLQAKVDRYIGVS